MLPRPRRKPLNEMTGAELDEMEQRKQESLNVYEQAIANNEANGYGHTENTQQQRATAQSLRDELTAIRKVKKSGS